MDSEERMWMGKIEEKLDNLAENFKNHLHNHFIFTMTLLSISGGLLATVILLITKYITK